MQTQSYKVNISALFNTNTRNQVWCKYEASSSFNYTQQESKCALNMILKPRYIKTWHVSYLHCGYWMLRKNSGVFCMTPDETA